MNEPPPQYPPTIQFSFQSLYLFDFIVIFLHLLSHLTLTFESFKHKKAPN